MHRSQGRPRDLHGAQSGGGEGEGTDGGGGGGRTIDFAGTRTVKEILRVVNARRMSVEIGRRLSANAEVDDNNPHTPSAAAGDNGSGSAAPAASASMSVDAGSSAGGFHRGNGRCRAYLDLTASTNRTVVLLLTIFFHTFMIVHIITRGYPCMYVHDALLMATCGRVSA